MSVWEDPDVLRNYAFCGEYVAIMHKRKQWFAKFDGIYTALWWISARHTPSVEETKVRLEYLRINGESLSAFSFKKLFPMPQNV